ncbi:hypothetical protein RYZ26_11865 [Terasakiella sp. A23]|uniref:hypothetical protein n=1 Tax=Terasakiella sp. FCG-A23 TaxID=3080561 RepID=UPI002954575E|nr:hypothetical protein [Terasakiella sp. A23]MDV7340294.1 hypothetical protein [Terasakiella sp. A23]
MLSTTKWSQRGEEPKLNDLMSDPIVGLIMARDNLQANDVWKVVEKAKEQIDKKAA